ncbi:MAG: serine/threonine protein kinase [Oscillatoria sp. SIO1A7]|nr:serine/threonine protein kinase [Oscillatoria sp. SIO1A7]
MNSQNWAGKLTHQGVRNMAPLLPKYRIIKLVGQGQFGQVFCGAERKTGELVALKELAHQRLSTSKFLRELGTLLTLQHPNIVTCRAMEGTAKARYLVMDYCEGGTLRNLLEQEDSLSLGEGLELMQGILAGLERAHQQKIIHCDIKPENILLTLNEGIWLPQLSDFGIARRLGSEKQRDGSIEVVGAPAYTPPEGFYGLYSLAVDIYAMGIIFFELLFGRRPFSGVPERLMWAHLNQRLEFPPELPESLRAILEKSLAKLTGRRYARASQMSAAIALAAKEPEVKELMGRPLPLVREPLAVAMKTIAQTIALEEENKEQKTASASPTDAVAPIRPMLLPGAANSLLAGDRYLVGALVKGEAILVWDSPQSSPIPVHFLETAIAILPISGGCLVLTSKTEKRPGGFIYWLAAGNWQPQRLLDFERDFTAAAEPGGRWLAVAIASKDKKNPPLLQFYSLSDASADGSRKLAQLLQSLSIPVPKLPQLMFLDRRHLLAISSYPEEHRVKTTLRAYTRRGTSVGSIRLSAVFEQLLPSDCPYTLWGISAGPRPAVWRIKLLPLQVMRIPLAFMPACFCPLPGGGCAIASLEGQVLWLDEEARQARCFQGPKAPAAIAPVPGYNSLAIATLNNNSGYIYFVDLGE